MHDKDEYQNHDKKPFDEPWCGKMNLPLGPAPQSSSLVRNSRQVPIADYSTTHGTIVSLPSATHSLTPRLSLAPLHTCPWYLSQSPVVSNILRFPLQLKQLLHQWLPGLTSGNPTLTQDLQLGFYSLVQWDCSHGLYVLPFWSRRLFNLLFNFYLTGIHS